MGNCFMSKITIEHRLQNQLGAIRTIDTELSKLIFLESSKRRFKYEDEMEDLNLSNELGDV